MLLGMLECDECDFKWSQEIEFYSFDFCPRCGEKVALTIE